MLKQIYLSSIVVLLFLSLGSCRNESIPPSTSEGPDTIYSIQGSEIHFNGQAITLNGVNALHTFGLEDLTLMNSWEVKIVREFIGNLREQPISGGALQGADGKWLHPLDQIVESNREQGIVTILCPFGWVSTQAEFKLFTGLNPSEQPFYQEYKNKMREIASHFSGQDDVWLEVWNEPFHWNNQNNYSHEMWYSDMSDMVGNLRSIDGFENIIVVPGNEQGQGEAAILEKGKALVESHQNILFDIHAYEKWLVNSSETEITERIQNITDLELAFIFGEVGVINVEDLMRVTSFLGSVKKTNTSTLAWLWKRDSNDQNALLTENDSPNDNNNNQWGSTFREFLK